jgi:disulfide bond formation protein DsbB
LNSFCLQRKIFLGVAGLALSGVVAAVGLQAVESLTPCPLCILQRVSLLLLAVFSLVRAEHPRLKVIRWTSNLFVLGSSLACMGIAAQHYYEQTHPIEFSTCAPGFETWWNALWLARALPSVFEATGQCMLVDVTLMGLPLPVWSFVLALFCFVAVVFALIKRPSC